MRFALLAVLFACAGCAVAPRAALHSSPRTIPVACGAGGIDVECFRAASQACGPAGYDLFDAAGRPATVADAAFRVLEAHCRE